MHDIPFKIIKCVFWIVIQQCAVYRMKQHHVWLMHPPNVMNIGLWACLYSSFQVMSTAASLKLVPLVLFLKCCIVKSEDAICSFEKFDSLMEEHKKDLDSIISCMFTLYPAGLSMDPMLDALFSVLLWFCEHFLLGYHSLKRNSRILCAYDHDGIALLYSFILWKWKPFVARIITCLNKFSLFSFNADDVWMSIFSSCRCTLWTQSNPQQFLSTTQSNANNLYVL